MGNLKLRRLASDSIYPTLVFLGRASDEIAPICKLTVVAEIGVRFWRRNLLGYRHMVIFTAFGQAVTLGKHFHRRRFARIGGSRDKIHVFEIVL